ncbi:hypothetical protein JAAARDRAFT_32954 [Jaapia argillacea MUCL 33604]|uniref:Zn(2)-C6 fungal-type domain-containing protein n=1 Tax=Jaapia argillacea MUCL 33604 TaxID=933084 RepID=A0A067PZU7_9AGAM|nr:hypothetical protein JAAARDRAFT_32954 [Jaapia argillacea MUCL 33604]
MDPVQLATQPQSPDNSSKAPVVRGARACTVCRQAKMKCVGSEDGTKQCQRCKRAGVECVFEKHRRGRKPGSKLSEASKMLRRLEKGLNNAKMKSQAAESAPVSGPFPPSESRTSPSDAQFYPNPVRPADQFPPQSNAPFSNNQLPPLQLPPMQGGESYSRSSHSSRSIDPDEEPDNERSDEAMFPAKLIRKENQRNSFFRTILNPEHESPAPNPSDRSTAFPAPLPPPVTTTPSTGLNDPITAGIMDEENASHLFDMLFLRLNPFVNLFDPALHSVNYVRSRCPFLFTTLIMAGCKFFQPSLYKSCQKLANEFAVRAFAEGWKRVEVVQAFACLIYWKEPDDTRTWTYIGYACRMAVELGLNRYVPHPPPTETELQRRERRNRERTYLVLFVHDRSLSMQTGRQWMLPEDDLVRHAATWHEEGGDSIRPEDVIVAAFVQLRRIAAETTDVFYLHKGVPGAQHNDVNYEVLLRNCNGKLTQWAEFWQHEMKRAGGEKFHFSFLSFFRLHIRLFLNSFGIQASMAPTSRTSPSLQALSACYTSALESLQIVTKEFASIGMLRYGQDSITVMTAYSAVFLLKLLRSSNTLAQLHEGATDEIYSNISTTADAYQDASTPSHVLTSAAYHSRFLRSLVTNDIFKAKQNERARQDGLSIDHRLHVSQSSTSPRLHSPPQMYPQPMLQSHEHNFHFPASPNMPAHPIPLHDDTRGSGYSESVPSIPKSGGGPSMGGPYAPHSHASHAQYASQPPSELDQHYWRNMFRELGFGENVESPPPHVASTSTAASAFGHGDHMRTLPPPTYDGSSSHRGHLPSYHYLHSAPGFGH